MLRKGKTFLLMKKKKKKTRHAHGSNMLFWKQLLIVDYYDEHFL